MTGRFIRTKRLVIGTVILLAVAGYAGHVWWTQQETARLRESCSRWLSSQRWGELETDARRWTSLAPQDGQAWYHLGMAFERSGSPEEALSAYDRIAETDPRWITGAEHRLSLLFGPLHRPIDGLQVTEEVLSRDPRNRAARFHRCYYWAMTMQRAPLLREAREAIRQHADLPGIYAYLVILEGFSFEDFHFQDGVDVVTRWAEQTPERVELQTALIAQRLTSTRGLWIVKGASARADFDAVHAEARAWLERHPDQLTLLDLLLDDAVADGNIADVEFLLGQCPPELIDNPVVWRCRAWYHLQHGELAEAETCLQRARELHGISWQVLNELAQLRRAQQRHQDAERLQRLAARGQELFERVRNLPHLLAINEPILRSLAEYASDCEDWEIAKGIRRRLHLE